MEKYEVIKKVKEGYVDVYRGRVLQDDSVVDMKIVKYNPKYGVSSSVTREISLMKELKHNYVVGMVDVIDIKDGFCFVFEHKNDMITKFNCLVQENNPRGTCITSIVGRDFIIVAGDGRSMVLKGGAGFLICSGNERKINMINSEMIYAVAGDPKASKTILNDLDMSEKNIFAFASNCDFCLDMREMMGKRKPDCMILVFGYSDQVPHMYSTHTRECVPLVVGSIHGCGFAFPSAEKYLLGKFHHFHTHPSVEDFANFLRDAYAVTSIENEGCGGIVTIGTIMAKPRGMRANLVKDQHVLGIISTRFMKISHLLSRCIIFVTYGLKYTIGENVVEQVRILKDYRRAKSVQVLGVARGKCSPDIIIRAVVFSSSADLKKTRIKYGTTNRNKRVMVKVLKATAQVLAHYAKLIEKNPPSYTY